MSSPVEETVSKRPPFHAVAIAMTVPSTIANATTANGPISEVRAPTRSRENKSRPCPSKPRKCDPVDPTYELERLTWLGSNGVTIGPNTATNAATTMMANDR